MIENDQTDIEGKILSVNDITALVDTLCETARKSNVSSDDFISDVGLINPIFPDELSLSNRVELRKVEKEND